MAISLKKNSGIRLTKDVEGNVGLQLITLGLGWTDSDGYKTVQKEMVVKTGGFFGIGGKKTTHMVEEKVYVGGRDVDLDATVLAYKNGRLVGECSFRTKNSPIFHNGNMILKHFGDDTTGRNKQIGDNGKKDNETIKVLVSDIGDFADTLYLVLNIYNAQNNKQTLDIVKDAYVKVYGEDGEELANFNLSEDYKGKTGSIVGKVIMSDGAWEFIALGDGVNVRNIDDLIAISTKY